MENRLPETLVETIRYFSDPQVCHDFAVNMRWPEGVECPHCGCDKVGFIATRKKWNCKGCKKRFSVKVGTIFEDSPLGMDTWIVAMWLIVNAKNGSSSCEVGRVLGITQKSAWFVLHRIRLALRAGSIEKMTGTFVGGLEKNKHKDKKQHKGRGGVGKTIVLGVLKRTEAAGKISQIRVKVIPNTKQETLHSEIKSTVETGDEVFTDAHKGYRGLEDSYRHAFVDHAIEYVNKRVSTNRVENFWSLLDRMVHGTYIKPEAQHLLRYADEQAFRFNHRTEQTSLGSSLQSSR